MAEELTFEDPVFGTLTFDPDVDWFEGVTKGTLGSQGEVRIYIDSRPEDLPSRLQAAHATLKELESAFDSIVDRMVAEYLPIKNESWLEEGEPEVAEPEFRARIALDYIQFGEERTTVVFRDGDLFWGHEIEVRLEPGVQVLEICL